MLSYGINGIIYKKYISPFITSSVQGVKIEDEVTLGKNIISQLLKLYQLSKDTIGYELKVVSKLCSLWIETMQYINEQVDLKIVSSTKGLKGADEIKSMLSYIHNNYHTNISIEKILKVAKISRSECFRCFKYYTSKTPIEYLNEYRLLQAAKLLKISQKPVMEISLSCGFDNQSYFGKLFKAKYGMSPLKYRYCRVTQ